MRQIVVVVLLAVALPATAAAQWDIEETVDPFTDESTFFAYLKGEENKLTISYSCHPNGSELIYLVFWFAVDADLFADGRVQIRFDDDTAERAEWIRDGNTRLTLPVAFVRRMAQPQHQTLLLGVTAFPSDTVRDRLDLTGTAAMLEQSDCWAE